MSDEFTLITGADASIWQLAQHRHATSVTQENISGVEQWEYGTYVSLPYFVFVKRGQKTMLVSDLGLVAELTYIGPNNDGTNLGAKFAVTPTSASAHQFGSYSNVVLSYNDACLGADVGFVVTGTDPNFAPLPSIPAGDSSNSDYFYVKVEPNPDAMGRDQTWSNVFTHKQFGSKALIRAFNAKVMDHDNYENARASDLPADLEHIRGDQSVFVFPGPTSMNYDTSDPIPVPWGWKYKACGEGHGKDTSTMMSSAVDVMNSTMKSSGYHYKAEIGGEVGPVEASANYSKAKNHGLEKKMQRVGENETTTTENTHVWTEFALIVDKRNARLNPDFRKKIGELAAEVKTLTDAQMDSFFDVWGTHWVSAATFGAKGTCTETYDKETVRRIVANDVSVDSEWSAGASVKVFDVGGSFDYGEKKVSDTAGQSERDATRSELFKTYSCIGGGSCQGGDPGSGEDRPPIYLDLRPISELLAPPFFTDPHTTLNLRRIIEEGISRYAFEPDALQPPPLRAYELEFSPLTTTGLASIATTVEFPSVYNGNPYEAGYDFGASMVAKGPPAADPAAYKGPRPCHWEWPELGAKFVIVVGRETRHINILLKYETVESHPVLGDGLSYLDNDSGPDGLDLASTGPFPLHSQSSSSSGGQTSVVDIQGSVTVKEVDLHSLMGIGS